MFSDDSLDEVGLDVMVLVKQQGLTLSLVVFFEVSEDELDLVILVVWWTLTHKKEEGNVMEVCSKIAMGIQFIGVLVYGKKC